VVIEQMNQSRIYTLSVDIPSGIDCDRGKIMGTAVRADQIVCLEYMKQGLVDNPYIHADIRVVPIGIPQEAKEAVLGEDWR
jgi:NAD(P)H-hydrate epimerase